MRQKKLSLFVLLCLFNSCISLNIVMFLSYGARTHLNFATALGRLLLARGHNVDFILGRINTVAKITDEDLVGFDRTLIYTFAADSPWMKVQHLSDPLEENNTIWQDLYHRFRIHNPMVDVYHISSAFLCRDAIQAGDVLKFLKEKKYDVGLFSGYDPCGVILFDQAKIPSKIAYTPTTPVPETFYLLGLPSPPSFLPDTVDNAVLTEQSTIVDRAVSFMRTAYDNFINMPWHTKYYNDLVQESFENFTSIEELWLTVDLFFINKHELLTRARPISHRIRYIGGVALPDPKPLPQEFQDIFASSTRGVVLFSFGTQVPTKLISLRMRRMMAEAMGSFPDVTFLWKYDLQGDEDGMFEKFKNIRIVSWLPQRDLLNDARVIGFITHMGQNSLLEAAFSGVPLIGIPLFTDQPHNARDAEARGLAIVLNKRRLNTPSITEALNQIVNNATYLERARQIAKMLNEKPEKLKEQFVEWVEYAARNPGLNQMYYMEGSRFGLVKYYGVDSFFFLIVVFIGFLFVSFRIIKLLFCKRQVKIKQN